MKFWDSSAVVPLLANESSTDLVLRLLKEDSDLIVWWGTEVECVSALARIEREDPGTASAVDEALARLDALKRSWHEIQPVPAVRDRARRLLRVHPLRAADALQLAAAVVASENRPDTMEFVCLDQRLVAAARREGFMLPLGSS
jgi:predicted nucleic acid-binding protein